MTVPACHPEAREPFNKELPKDPSEHLNLFCWGGNPKLLLIITPVGRVQRLD